MNARRCIQPGGGGFALPSAIFLLVILASLAAFLVNISMTQSVTSTQDVQGARAYQAARAGVEWGLYRVLDPLNVTAVPPGDPAWPNLKDCTDASPPGPLLIEGFTVVLRCLAYPGYAEAGLNRRITVYVLAATASAGGAPGAANYIERRVEVTVSKCRATDGVAPGYECP